MHYFVDEQLTSGEKFSVLLSNAANRGLVLVVGNSHLRLLFQCVRGIQLPLSVLVKNKPDCYLIEK